MGFMGFMHTNCGSGSDLNQLPSSYIPIYGPGPKTGLQDFSILIKPNFLPNFMCFKVGFHGLYGFYSYRVFHIKCRKVNKYLTL